MSLGLLSVVTFLPAVGALALAAVPRRLSGIHRAGALVVSLLTLLVSIPLWTRFDGDSADFQFEELPAGCPRWG
jgi:NADH-quinone oxidoreductase subunit M